MPLRLSQQPKKVKLNSGIGAGDGTQLKEVGSGAGNYSTQIPIDSVLRPKSIRKTGIKAYTTPISDIPHHHKRALDLNSSVTITPAKWVLRSVILAMLIFGWGLRKNI